MSKMTTNPLSAPPAADLRRTFEIAIAQIQHGGKTRSRSQTPIVVRKETPMPGDPSSEKRALTTAARALAQLWNISPTLIR
jgi:hypothetical protein